MVLTHYSDLPNCDMNPLNATGLYFFSLSRYDWKRSQSEIKVQNEQLKGSLNEWTNKKTCKFNANNWPNPKQSQKKKNIAQQQTKNEQQQQQQLRKVLHLLKKDSSRQKLFHYHSIIESGPLSSLIFIESVSRLTLYMYPHTMYAACNCCLFHLYSHSIASHLHARKTNDGVYERTNEQANCNVYIVVWTATLCSFHFNSFHLFSPFVRWLWWLWLLFYKHHTGKIAALYMCNAQ